MIYFVSDVHLGSLVMTDAHEHQQRFIRLLRQMERDATEIHLLGDIFDFWYEYYWSNKRHLAQFEPVLDVLADITKHCPVHFYIGNHDMWTFGLLAKRTGMTIHYEPETRVLNGKTCYLAHGDGLGSTNKAFLRLRAFFHHPVPRFLYRTLPPCVGDFIGYRWAASSRRKEMANPEVYKGEANEDLIRFAKQYEPAPDYFIFGHRHIELSLLLPSRACVYILGDFFRQFTFAQMDEVGNMSIEQFLEE